ncbi:PHP domain-containing protein [Actinospica durhamensis]|uniref:PHP domain-containing protein n=1 Tax=Actinospica durhamensis TaxID=1508375 RepID=UPI0034D6827A
MYGGGADDRGRMVPPDNHVHSQWSWDALAGSMERTCARAVELGLPAVAFTEHADFAPWTLPPQFVPPEWQGFFSDGVLTPPPLDVAGYLECLERCQVRHPGLRIISGVELSEPHWYPAEATRLLESTGLERVLASVHSAPTADGRGFTEVSDRYEDQAPGEVVRAYLAEIGRLIERFPRFEILAHIDYPVRSWPAGAKPYDPHDFEDEYRHVLRMLAGAGKTLELSTKVPLHPEILTWWRQEGGRTITFASDAHHPDALAHGFREAARVASAAGFRAGRDPLEFWRCA